jgi:hypothetical protein
MLQPAKKLPHPLQRLVNILHRRRIRNADVFGRAESFSRNRGNVRLVQQSVRDVGA